ncbi:LuxR C-terminal-related transcriptional regulator [Xanthobacteraceae bacterium Astr-EGSB]|uniref:helix-turn-helix transcriptional regulator n=1 Tax=Astrobacterium formosum TaxID=3069710 RepID=UPI0027B05D49|nr:LuxR C-terminal-related transcriptional regulator [Xanthobacteraceae bacterium Astr-EGSB]
MPATMLLALEGMVEPFLVKWTEHMGRAGYLRFTTAKKQDCVDSFVSALTPLWTELRAGRPVGDFSALLRRRDGWADPVLTISQSHRFRGVTAEMFIGCLKTLFHSVEDLLHEMNAPAERTLAALDILHRYADAMDTLLVGHWTKLSQEEAMAKLDASNRQLTLQKNKFENIFATTSDLVLVADVNGRIDEANQAARAFFDKVALKSIPVWDLLGLGGASMAAVLSVYPPDATHEISIRDGTVFLDLRIAPLSSVSLASSGFLFLLTDITSHVRNRVALEERVRERTSELEQKTVRLEEMNITLRNVLSCIDSERKEFQRSVAHAVQTTLLPTLRHVQSATDATVRQGYAGMLSDQLMQLYEDSDSGSDARLMSLTPAELKVCQLIQSGHRTKEIADTLNLSIDTVQSHRKSIRRKLSLSGKEVNLFTFLKARA